MCLISVPNLKEIDKGEGCFLAQRYCVKSVQRCEENWAIFRSIYLANY